jgi:TfoX/Sxy family transcriptional regulator of competence genes
MAFDQDLAARVRAALAGAGAVREVKMFGGIGFMLNGNLIAGASRRGLLVRVGKEREGDALTQRGARPMVMRGRTMQDYIYIDPPVLDDQAVQKWIKIAIGFVQSLPAKRAAAKPKRAKTKATGRARGI